MTAGHRVSYTDADVELAADALYGAEWRDPSEPAWDALPSADQESYRVVLRAVLSALAAAGRDHAAGVAEGRRQVAAELSSYALNYPPEIFPPDSDSHDAIGGTAMRHAYLNAARIAEEGSTE